MGLIKFCAHAQHAFGRTLHMDQTPGHTFAQHSHEPVAAVEGDGIEPLCGLIPASLSRKGEQRPLHRIAFDRPDPILAIQTCIVAKGRRERQLPKITGRRDRPFGGIALARDGEGA